MIRWLLQARRPLAPPQRQLRQQQNNAPTPLRRQRLPKGLRRGSAHDAIQASARLREAPCSPESATRGILSTYKRHQSWDIERAFRTSKSLFETRPIYHKLDETIRGHVSCSFLALVLKRKKGTGGPHRRDGRSRAIGVLARDPRRPRLADRDRGRTGREAFRPALAAPPRRELGAARRRRRPAAHRASAPRRLTRSRQPNPKRSATALFQRRFVFVINALSVRGVEDQFDVAAVIAGDACALIHDIPPAREIVERTVSHAE